MPSRASPGAGWRPASSPNHRGATDRPQGSDHLHTAVSTLGHTRRFSGQYRSCGALGVEGIGLNVMARAWPPALRALDLQYLDSPGLQVAGELKAP